MKPIHRSKLRLFCGKTFYYLKRQADWRRRDKKYSRSFEAPTEFPLVLFQHGTPLLRSLPQVDLPLQLNKITNLKIAVNRLNHLVINPGEIFSFWLLVGKPSRSKGYRAGFVLEQGKVKPGIGGGLCQLTNLIYWMALHSPLTIIERWRHSYDVFPDTNRTIPFGSGATCSYPALDLQLMNPGKNPIQLQLELSSTHLIGKWCGQTEFEHSYQIYEATHEIYQDIWGHYIRHNIIRRRVYSQEQTQIADEFVAENRALMMYQPFLTEKSTQISF